MSAAVLADIHGNLPALEAVLAEPDVARRRPHRAPGRHRPRTDAGGDAGPARVAGRRAVWVHGNCEREVVTAYDGKAAPGPTAEGARATAALLERRHRDLIDDLPMTVTLDIDGLGAALFCHATPRRDDEFVLVDSPVPVWRQRLAGCRGGDGRAAGTLTCRSTGSSTAAASSTPAASAWPTGRRRLLGAARTRCRAAPDGVRRRRCRGTYCGRSASARRPMGRGVRPRATRRRRGPRGLQRSGRPAPRFDPSDPGGDAAPPGARHSLDHPDGSACVGSRDASTTPRPARRDDQPGQLRLGFARIRDELRLPDSFPPDVQAEAEAAAQDGASERTTGTTSPTCRSSPSTRPGSTDLDQAMHIERRGGGYRVRYAIADVGAFVAPGRRDRRRGAPARPDAVRPGHAHAAAPAGAVRGRRVAAAGRRSGRRCCGRSTSTRDGERSAVDVRRALVRSRRPARLRAARRQRSTPVRPTSAWRCSREMGRAAAWRWRSSAAGSSLPIPEQEVVPRTAGGASSWRTARRCRSRRWNAQISLMTGMAAADLMLHGEVGVLRTLPTAPTSALDAAAPRGAGARRSRGRADAGLRRARSAAWTRRTRGTPRCCRTRRRCCAAPATRRSTAACRSRPPTPRSRRRYAHATAPLRRLVDRYVGEVCLALCAGVDVAGLGARRRCPRCRRRWRTATGAPASWSASASTSWRRPCCTARVGESSTRSRSIDVKRGGGTCSWSSRRYGRRATATCRWASRSGYGSWRPTSRARGAVRPAPEHR